MLSKIVSLSLVFFLFNMALSGVAFAGGGNNAGSQEDDSKIAKKAAKVKKGIEKLGVSKESKVKIRLRDKSKIKGYISEIDEDNFTVVNDGGTASTIDYRDVEKINGTNLPAGAWFAIGAAVAVGVLFVVVAIGLRNGS